jgi:hypothetical protein
MTKNMASVETNTLEKDKNKPFVQNHKFPSYLLPFDCQSQSHFRSLINWAAKTKNNLAYFSEASVMNDFNGTARFKLY